MHQRWPQQLPRHRRRRLRHQHRFRLRLRRSNHRLLPCRRRPMGPAPTWLRNPPEARWGALKNVQRIRRNPQVGPGSSRTPRAKVFSTLRFRARPHGSSGSRQPVARVSRSLRATRSRTLSRHTGCCNVLTAPCSPCEPVVTRDLPAVMSSRRLVESQVPMGDRSGHRFGTGHRAVV